MTKETKETKETKNDNIYCIDTKERFQNYDSYLQSIHFALKKQDWLKTKKVKCSICKRSLKRNSSYTFRHLHFTRLGRERLNDICLVCSFCSPLMATPWRDNLLQSAKKRKQIYKNQRLAAKRQVTEYQELIKQINKLVKKHSENHEEEIAVLKKKLYRLH